MERVCLNEKFGLFDEHWSPKIIAEVNDTQVKLVKFKGDFIWHHHEAEDELFLVVKGAMCMRLRGNGGSGAESGEREVALEEGEMIVVPHGVEHCPSADEEVWVMLIEPGTTRNTGETESDRAVEPERI